MSREAIIHAYRHLYRGLLHAVQFEVRARVVARDQLRTAFREKGATYDATGIQRTIWFLKAAAKQRGLEHKILKNLIRTAYTRTKFTEWGSHVRHITLGKQRYVARPQGPRHDTDLGPGSARLRGS